MSRYFARLAQRSGLIAPPAPPSHVQADIVEQDHHIDVALAPPAPGAATTYSAPPGSSSSISAPPAPDNHAVAAGVAPAMPSTRATEISEISIDALSSISPPVPSSMRHAASTPSLRRSLNAPSIEAPTPRTETPVMTHPASLPAIQRSAQTSVHYSSTQLAPSPSLTAARMNGPALPASESPEVSADSVVASPPPATRMRRRPPPRSATTRADKHVLLDNPIARRSDMPEIAAPPAPQSTPDAAREHSARNVDVRIGAVRLEIHAPTPAPVAPAPAPVAASEPPRFTPRRHYLRG